ncbi:MAG: CDP-alcohol phosphatidyltransferase family protein [Rhizobiaceae bacterium]|jgi:phosphatidylglycerophosphate synthase|nr:CDP-alcohol phosphatidyltransferase family protein [Rhizobiaceae bacterium]
MFDGSLRRIVDPFLLAVARPLAQAGATPDGVTLFGFALALAAAAAIMAGWLMTGFALMVASRLCDGLDGTIAKLTKPSDFGGYLDIVLDFAFYGLIPLSFAVFDPQANALPAAVLLLSFYVNGASFLALSAIAAKRGMTTEARGRKSFYFPTGLAEAGETFAVFAAFCLFPAWFGMIAYGFAALCFLTAAARILEARALLRA